MALFNALNWMYSPFWNGKYALVVTSDIAVYGDVGPNATGGAGAVCILLGPNAPMTLGRDYTSFTKHVYDFFKPNPVDGLPVVDGPLSLKSFFGALIKTFADYKKKTGMKRLEEMDYICCHTPFAKQVEKSVLLMKCYDALYNEQRNELEDHLYIIIKQHNIRDIFEMITHKQVMQDCMAVASELVMKLVGDSLLLNRRIGNAYTSSVFISLYGLLSRIMNNPFGFELEEMDLVKLNKPTLNIFMFSYGSGCMARLYSISLDMSRLDQLNLTSPMTLLTRKHVSYDQFMEWNTKYQQLRLQSNAQLEALESDKKPFYHIKSIVDWRRAYGK